MASLTREVQMSSRDEPRDHMSIVIAEKRYMKDVVEVGNLMGFHVVDMKELGDSRLDTPEFCDVLHYGENGRFMLILPRTIPSSVCMFLNWVCEEQIVHTGGGFGSTEKYLPFQGKAFVLLMERADFANVELSNGWPRYKLDRCVAGHCWLVDER